MDDNIIFLIKQWQRGRGNIIVDDELAQVQFEPKYKIVKSRYLYRGFWAPSDAPQSLDEKGYFEYNKNYKLTSWTTSPKIAILFAQGFYSKKDREQIRKRHRKVTLLTSCGVAIKKLTKDLDILVNLVTLPYYNKYKYQKEVIVIGNGISKIRKKDIIYHHWYKFRNVSEDIEFIE